ncbi:P450 CYP319A1-like protein, partial [Dinothrombium tinctorium]
TYLNEQATDRTLFTWFLEEYLGKGLLTESGPRWTARRKFLSHTFDTRLFNQFKPTIDDYSRQLIDELNHIVENSNGLLEDLDKFMSELSINVLLDTIMGIDAKSERLLCKRYAEATELCVLSLYERVYKPWIWLNCLYFRLTREGKRVKQAVDFVHNFADTVIAKREQKLLQTKAKAATAERIVEHAISNGKLHERTTNEEQNGNGFCFEARQRKRKPFLDNLLELHYANSNLFTKQNIRDEVNTFLTAGHHTTSIALTFTVYLLGLHPKIQEQ